MALDLTVRNPYNEALVLQLRDAAEAVLGTFSLPPGRSEVECARPEALAAAVVLRGEEEVWRREVGAGQSRLRVMVPRQTARRPTYFEEYLAGTEVQGYRLGVASGAEEEESEAEEDEGEEGGEAEAEPEGAVDLTAESDGESDIGSYAGSFIASDVEEEDVVVEEEEEEAVSSGEETDVTEWEPSEDEDDE